MEISSRWLPWALVFLMAATGATIPIVGPQVFGLLCRFAGQSVANERL